MAKPWVILVTSQSPSFISTSPRPRGGGRGGCTASGMAGLIPFIWCLCPLLCTSSTCRCKPRRLDFQAIWWSVPLFFSAPHESVLRKSNSIDLHEPVQLMKLLRGVSSCAPSPLSVCQTCQSSQFVSTRFDALSDLAAWSASAKEAPNTWNHFGFQLREFRTLLLASSSASSFFLSVLILSVKWNRCCDWASLRDPQTHLHKKNPHRCQSSEAGLEDVNSACSSGRVTSSSLH